MKQSHYIMITRPAHQAGQLVEGINNVGADTYVFPTLEITPSKLSSEDKDKIQYINQYDIVIFISPNAVEHGLNHIETITKLSEQVLLATIGHGSATALMNRIGKQPDIVPEEEFNSEGLLATAAMQNVADKRILIIRGNGGREYLKQTLQQRGAHVDYICAYQRIKPATNTTDLVQYLQNNQIAAIVITSATSLNNLVEMTPDRVVSELFQIPLILINKRLIDIAKDVGFKNKLIVSSKADDNAIIESLKTNHLLL